MGNIKKKEINYKEYGNQMIITSTVCNILEHIRNVPYFTSISIMKKLEVDV